VAAASTGSVPLEAILAEGVRAAPDVGVLASRTGPRVSVLVWHYHDDDIPGPDAVVDLELSGLAQADSALVTHYRIDRDHSNAYAAWKRMGTPVAPNRKQYAELEAAGRLALMGEPSRTPVQSGTARIRFSLPRQGVSLLILE